MKISNKWVIPLAVAVLTFSIGGAAFAMSGSSSTDTTASGAVTTAAAKSSTGGTQDTTNTTAATTTDKDPGKQGNGEIALTGDTLAQVQAAALAAAGSGSTLVKATNETDNSDSTIRYEAFVKKSDGTAVKMYLDASFKVVSTESGAKGFGGCQGGRGGNGGNGETALTGDTLAQVQTAALAAAGSGSTLIRASNETDSSDSTIKYEAFVKKSDGTAVKMYLDASFKVVSTENAQMGDKHHGGADSDATGTSSSTTSN